MRRSARIVTVTGGLAALGAAAGAAVALVGFVTILIAAGVHGAALQAALGGLLLAAVLPKGAALGAVAGPPVAWALLRRVPVGWAALGTATGALIGGVSGDLLLSALFWGRPSPIRFGWLWCALVGVVVAALVLRRVFAPRSSPGSGSAAVAADESLQLTEARDFPRGGRDHVRASAAELRR